MSKNISNNNDNKTYKAGLTHNQKQFVFMYIKVETSAPPSVCCYCNDFIVYHSQLVFDLN